MTNTIENTITTDDLEVLKRLPNGTEITDGDGDLWTIAEGGVLSTWGSDRHYSWDCFERDFLGDGPGWATFTFTAPTEPLADWERPELLGLSPRIEVDDTVRLKYAHDGVVGGSTGVVRDISADSNLERDDDLLYVDFGGERDRGIFRHRFELVETKAQREEREAAEAEVVKLQVGDIVRIDPDYTGAASDYAGLTCQVLEPNGRCGLAYLKPLADRPQHGRIAFYWGAPDLQVIARGSDLQQPAPVERVVEVEATPPVVLDEEGLAALPECSVVVPEGGWIPRVLGWDGKWNAHNFDTDSTFIDEQTRTFARRGEPLVVVYMGED